jgi:hypothetical protein
VNKRPVSLATKLATVDQVADAALQPAAQSRYLAFRNALIADGQQDEQILQTLWLFLWNLADGRSVNGVH